MTPGTSLSKTVPLNQGCIQTFAVVSPNTIRHFGILRRHKTDPFHGSWKHPAVKARLDIEFSGGPTYTTEDENSIMEIPA